MKDGSYALHVLASPFLARARSAQNLKFTVLAVFKVDEGSCWVVQGFPCENLFWIHSPRSYDFFESLYLARMPVPKLAKNGFYSSFVPLSLVRTCLTGRSRLRRGILKNTGFRQIAPQSRYAA
jgi:hypothetical protein